MSPITSLEDSKPPGRIGNLSEVEGIWQTWRIRIQGARNNYEWTEISGWKLKIHAVKKEEELDWGQQTQRKDSWYSKNHAMKKQGKAT